MEPSLGGGSCCFLVNGCFSAALLHLSQVRLRNAECSAFRKLRRACSLTTNAEIPSGHAFATVALELARNVACEYRKDL